MFVQATRSKRRNKTYVSYLVRDAWARFGLNQVLAAIPDRASVRWCRR